MVTHEFYKKDAGKPRVPVAEVIDIFFSDCKKFRRCPYSIIELNLKNHSITVDEINKKSDELMKYIEDNYKPVLEHN